jgi:acetylornithine deacetylase
VIDAARLAADALALVSVASPTGDERAALEAAAELCRAHGLEAELRVHDLAALRAHPDHPGEEAPRSELLGLRATLPGTLPGRVAIDGHLDVVPGGPPAGLEGSRLHGRGAVDMKGAWVAALHAVAAVRDVPHPEIVLLGVASEEDGGLGTFAALQQDAAFDAALLPEPTAFEVVVAQAGALTFRGEVRGRAAHAAMRLEGESAIDRYVDEVVPALRAHEALINAEVAHPAMGALALPYPLSVGRLGAGEWSSSVPDRLVFEGRLGVRIGEDPAAARAALEERLGFALEWTGGAFHPGETDPAHPWVDRVAGAVEAETGRVPGRVGVPYGADMRLFTARGIPTVMVGTRGLERAHSDHEWADTGELAALARIIARAISA